MRKIKHYASLLLFLSLLSCEQEEISPNNDYSIVPTQDGGKEVSQFFDWESAATILFGDNNTTVTLPWYSASPTQIPNFILEDYTKADGWELLYNYCSEQQDPGKEYMIFYNKFTGVVRSFYYLSSTPSSNSNEGMWVLDMSGNHAMLNNVGYFAKPMDFLIMDPKAISTNIAKAHLTKAMTFGWNCFDTEITYDSYSTSKAIKMFIGTYNNNVSDITLSGNLDLKSEGGIFTTNSTNQAQTYVNNAAKTAGKGAVDWAKSNIGDKNDPSKIIKVAASLLSEVASGGVESLIKAGVNLVFGSFIGRHSKTSETKQRVELKTNGTITLAGQITGLSGSPVTPISRLYVPMTQVTNDTDLGHYTKRLGAWNITNDPIVLQAAQAAQVGYDEALGMNIYERAAELDNSSFSVVINPDLLSEISHYETKYDLVYYHKFQNNFNWNGINMASDAEVSGSGNPLYIDNETEIWRMFGEKIYGGSPDYPTNEPDPSGMPQLQGVPYIKYHNINNKYVVKVSVTLYPKTGYNQEPITLTRSYIPQVQLYNLPYAEPEHQI